MKLFGRKTLALLLALTMTVVLMSVSAFAADPTGITMDSTLSLKAGTTATLTPTFTPAESTATPTWSSDNTGVATVNNGTVTAIKSGTATITAKVNDKLQATCTVTVTKADLVSVTKTSGEVTTPVAYGTAKSTIEAQLKALKYTFTYGSGANEETVADQTISDWTCTPAYDGTKPGSYSFVGSVGTVKSAAISVTVNKGAATAVDYSKTVSVENAPDMTGDKAVESMPKTFSATVNGTTYNNLAVSNYYGAWEHPGATGVLKTGTYTYTAAPQSNAALTGLPTLSVTLTVNAKTVSNISANLFYDEDGLLGNVSANVGRVDLRSLILAQLPKNASGSNALAYGTITFTNYSMNIGRMDGEIWRVDSWRYSDNSKETGSVQYSVAGTGSGNTGLMYNGTVNLTAFRFTGNIEASITNTSGTADFFRTKVVDEIEKYLNALGLSNSYYVVFDDIGSDGGTLYLTSSKNDVAETDEVYSRSDLRDMYYESNYDGEKFELNYSVYNDKDAGRYNRIFSGSIVIRNPQILNLKVSITKDDVYNFSSQELQDALSVLDSDWTLTRIYLNNISTNGGKLCYDYDDSKALSKNASASRGEYYVEPSKSSQKSIDLITYVPKEKSSSRSYTAEFGFEAHYTYTTKQGKERTGTVDGMLVITVQEPADITISAPANGYATLDASLFTDYCADHVRSTHKNYELCYVEFTGAPNSTAYGYLYENYKSGIYNGAKIKSPNGKKFALTDISAKDKNAYDLESVSYVPGTRNCTGGTFAIYGVKPGTTIKSSTSFTKLCEGTIDFVIDGGSVSGNTKKVDLLASQTYSNFYYDLINSNVASVRFVSVTGGKLIYRDVSSQTPITPGTDVYYLSSTGYLAGRRMLSNVVFLPGYNQTSATITLKAFDAKDKSANAQYIFTIKPVTSSSFSDMNGYSSYAGSVGLMTNLGIINGVGNNKFNPSGSVTRGEWITMLYRAAGSPAVYSSANFTDVPIWCKDAVQWAVQNGITDGIGNNKFGPDMTLDRMQIVTFMYRFAKLQGMDVSSTLYLSAYTDGNTVDAWAQPAMKWALQKGYLDPVGGKIQPKGTMTRVLVADCLARLLTK